MIAFFPLLVMAMTAGCALVGLIAALSGAEARREIAALDR